MYQSFRTIEPMNEWNATMLASDWVKPVYPELPVAGADQIDISPVAMEGLWSLRFGRFGCSDSETRGGVVHIQGDTLIGGDNNFAYQGRWTTDGSELTASLDIARHGIDCELPTVFGTLEAAYQLDCVAEAITPDLFEGRLRRAGHPDVRLVMRRVRDVAEGRR